MAIDMERKTYRLLFIKVQGVWLVLKMAYSKPRQATRSPKVMYGDDCVAIWHNNYKLVNHSFHYDLRKHFLSARIVNTWNSLPDSVVDPNTVIAYKAPLDKFRSHQAVKYDFTADLTETGNRLEDVLKSQSFLLS